MTIPLLGIKCLGVMDSTTFMEYYDNFWVRFILAINILKFDEFIDTTPYNQDY